MPRELQNCLEVSVALEGGGGGVEPVASSGLGVQRDRQDLDFGSE